MRPSLLILLLLSTVNFTAGQSPADQTIFDKIPYHDGVIIYEKVFYLDSVNNKEKLFNAAKAALIKNTNYKYSKIDEDRVAGNISTSITFSFLAKPGITTVNFTGESQLSVDVKENRFRVRIFNNNEKVDLLGVETGATMEDVFKSEKKDFDRQKWKEKKSMLISWHDKLSIILEAFGVLIGKNIGDDEF